VSTRLPGPFPIPVYDPRGVVRAERRPLAPRIAALGGLRLAILDNTKWNGRRVLERTAELLGAGAPFAAVTRYKKESFSLDAAPALIARIAAENDAVLTGIGD